MRAYNTLPLRLRLFSRFAIAAMPLCRSTSSSSMGPIVAFFVTFGWSPQLRGIFAAAVGRFFYVRLL